MVGGLQQVPEVQVFGPLSSTDPVAPAREQNQRPHGAALKVPTNVAETLRRKTHKELNFFFFGDIHKCRSGDSSLETILSWKVVGFRNRDLGPVSKCFYPLS